MRHQQGHYWQDSWSCSIFRVLKSWIWIIKKIYVPKNIILSYRSKILSRGNEKDLFLLMSGVGWIFPTALLCVWLTHYLLYKIGRTQSGATLEFQEMWSSWLYDWHESSDVNFESGVFHFILVFVLHFMYYCSILCAKSCWLCDWNDSLVLRHSSESLVF